MQQLPNGTIYPGAPEETHGPDSLPAPPKRRGTVLSVTALRDKNLEKTNSSGEQNKATSNSGNAASNSDAQQQGYFEKMSTPKKLLLFVAILVVVVVAAMIATSVKKSVFSSGSDSPNSSISQPADLAGNNGASDSNGGAKTGSGAMQGEHLSPAKVPEQISPVLRDANPNCFNYSVSIYTGDMPEFPGVTCSTLSNPVASLQLAQVVEDKAAAEEFFGGKSVLEEVPFDASAPEGMQIRAVSAGDASTFVGVKQPDGSLVVYQFSGKIEGPDLENRLRELKVLE